MSNYTDVAVQLVSSDADNLTFKVIPPTIGPERGVYTLPKALLAEWMSGRVWTIDDMMKNVAITLSLMSNLDLNDEAAIRAALVGKLFKL